MAHQDYFSEYIQKIMNEDHNTRGDSKKATAYSSKSGFEQKSDDQSMSLQIDSRPDEQLKDTEHKVQPVDLALLNGKLVIPGQGVFKGNIFINNGKIQAVSTDKEYQAREVVDVEEKYVLPGIIDPHVHLGIFGPLEKELVSETRSALRGGITTIGTFFGSEGSHLQTFPQIKEKINNLSNIDIIPHLILTDQLQKREFSEYVNQLGVTSFKLYMNGIPGLIPDVDDGFIMDVFDEVKKVKKKCLICVHSENRYLIQRASEKIEKKVGDKADLSDWSETHPGMAEEEAVIRLSYLAEKTGVSVYFVHISSAEAIMRLRKLKPYNKYINAETTSPYLSLTKDNLKGPLGKMIPPFRNISDLEELWKALDNGIVDTVGTDNVTMTREEKKVEQGIWEALSGYPALATHLPVMLNEGVIKRGLPIEKVTSVMTKNPAQLFGVYPQKGTIMPGSDADLVVVDLNLKQEVKVSNLDSRSDFSLYEGQSLQGWPVLTIKNGKIAVKNGNFTGVKGSGSVLKR